MPASVAAFATRRRLTQFVVTAVISSGLRFRRVWPISFPLSWGPPSSPALLWPWMASQRCIWGQPAEAGGSTARVRWRLPSLPFTPSDGRVCASHSPFEAPGLRTTAAVSGSWWETTSVTQSTATFSLCTETTFVLQNVWGFPGGSVVKNPPARAGHTGLIPRSGRSPGKGHGNPLQYSCLGNPVDRGARGATAHGVSKGRTWLSDWTAPTIHSRRR